VGVLACGLDIIYPPQNLELSRKIIANGALVSEYEPNSKPDRWNFPARNRIISALADLVFVVEGQISSGALLTAKSAIEQGRDLAALPGNINNLNSEGPNHLIQNGAALISKPEDLMEILQISTEHSQQIEINTILSAAEQKICDILAREKRNLSFDELFAQSGFNAGKLSTIITNLELKGLIAKDTGNTFMLI
jgi:DNA processing protein